MNKETKKVKNMLNFDHQQEKGEVNNMPSETVPDQSMSIQEILLRHSRGLAINDARVPIFDEDNDLPDIRTLDLSERAEYAERYREEISRIDAAHRDSLKKSETKPDQPGETESTNIP